MLQILSCDCMNEILKKRVADMTLSEVLEMAHLVSIAEKPTLNILQFCEWTQQDKRKVYKLINNRLLPEWLFVGGYENRKQKNKILFHTDKVLEYLKQ